MTPIHLLGFVAILWGVGVLIITLRFRAKCRRWDREHPDE
jgi:hypothetical protein